MVLLRRLCREIVWAIIGGVPVVAVRILPPLLLRLLLLVVMWVWVLLVLRRGRVVGGTRLFGSADSKAEKGEPGRG